MLVRAAREPATYAYPAAPDCSFRSGALSRNQPCTVLTPWPWFRWPAGHGRREDCSAQESRPRPKMGGPPGSAFRRGGPLGLREMSMLSFHRAIMGCGGRARRLAFDLCGCNLLLRPILLRRVVVCHERALAAAGSVDSRGMCPRPPKMQARRYSGQHKRAGIKWRDLLVAGAVLVIKVTALSAFRASEPAER